MMAGRGSAQINLRVPGSLKSRVEAWASRNGRSINSEIVVALEAAFPKAPEPETLPEEFKQAALEVAASMNSTLRALGQDPSSHPQLSRLMAVLEKAGKI